MFPGCNLQQHLLCNPHQNEAGYCLASTIPVAAKESREHDDADPPGQARVSCAGDVHQPSALRLAELDKLVARHAFSRAAAAFADAAAAAQDHRLDKARKLAAEAADHLATAQRAQNGLGFRTYAPAAQAPVADESQ
jgi:hypothetical protein